MITSSVPTDWRELQAEVARILEECGFEAEVEKTVVMVRGQAEIDVYAREVHHGRAYIVLCECKNWKNKVPQHVVHSFLTIMQSTGANMGYIIGASGFQSGAHEAAERSNIRLLDWHGFQNEFEQAWLQGSRMMSNLNFQLGYFSSAIRATPRHRLSEGAADRIEKMKELRDTYEPLIVVADAFSPGPRRYHPGYPGYPQLPLGQWAPRLDEIDDALARAVGYREAVAALTARCADVVAEFEALWTD